MSASCSTEAGGSIAYRFHARDAHLVLSPGAREPIPFRVLLDGEPPGPSHGVDVDEDGNGVLRDGRLYQLVRQHDAVRERTLEITFLEPGAEAYVVHVRLEDLGYAPSPSESSDRSIARITTRAISAMSDGTCIESGSQNSECFPSDSRTRGT